MSTVNLYCNVCACADAPAVMIAVTSNAAVMNPFTTVFFMINLLFFLYDPFSYMYRLSGPFIPAWAQSEPPRGSGWVRSRATQDDCRLSGYAPTRYREVVLTVSNCRSL